MAGCVGLWWRGYAFVPLPYVSSYDWKEYIPSAWMVAHGQDLGGYAVWRNPLYPGMVGGLGEHIGYNEASWLIASVSMFLVVVGAGLGARALAGPWAGMVAALTIPFINPWAEASRWATLYPVLTAATAMSVAAGAAMVRWPRLLWAVIAGTSAGIGWGVDFRGGALVVMVLVLGALALQARKQRALLAGGLLLAVILGPTLNHNLAVTGQESTDSSVGSQRALELRLAVQSANPALVSACTDAPTGSALPTLATFADPCAHAFLADNLDRMKDQAPFGVGLTLCLLPLVLLPGGRGRRDSVTALVVFGTIWGTMAVMGVWARLNVHHFVQFAAPIAMTVPVAVARLLQMMGPRGRRCLPFAGLLGSIWVCFYGPWANKPVTDISSAAEYRLLHEIIGEFENRLGPEDVAMDCSGLAIEAALLPRRFHPGPPQFATSADHIRCQQWIAAPAPTTGTAWLLTRENTGLMEDAPNWEEINQWSDDPRQFWLWRHVDTSPGQP